MDFSIPTDHLEKIFDGLDEIAYFPMSIWSLVLLARIQKRVEPSRRRSTI